MRSALEEGIITGGGLALYREAAYLNSYDKTLNINEDVALHILHNTLQTPLKQIIINAGVSLKEIEEKINTAFSIEEIGYDVKNEVVGNMYDMGIIDPLKVTKNALINAVSVATTILSTNAIVTHARA